MKRLTVAVEDNKEKKKRRLAAFFPARRALSSTVSIRNVSDFEVLTCQFTLSQICD